ncbi:MAG: hypothetical protein HY237_06305 [Acidobacteria bacterium]|nr:hypothetical protein [Acidobacteriota bacterium]
MPERFARLVFCGVLTSACLLAQTSHRRPNPLPPREPNIFGQLEKQSTQPPQEQAGRQAAARERRKANHAALNRELPQLIELAQNLQKQLEAADLESAVPADLERQARQLERVARQIHQRVRGL